MHEGVIALGPGTLFALFTIRKLEPETLFAATPQAQATFWKCVDSYFRFPPHPPYEQRPDYVLFDNAQPEKGGYWWPPEPVLDQASSSC